jgi:anti-repressor protein
MNQLIPIKESTINGETVQTVNARELHGYLESKQHFTDWIKARIDQYEFIAEQDFTLHNILTQYNQIDRIDYHISIDMAKELAMVERTDKGKQARQYFIECERKVKAQPVFHLPKTFSEALHMLADAVDREEANRPKVEAFDTFLGAKNSQTMNEAAKVLNIGRNTLFSILREREILMRNNLPYQRYINSDYFTVREYPIRNGEETITQTLVTAKGIEYIRKVLKGSSELLN